MAGDALAAAIGRLKKLKACKLRVLGLDGATRDVPISSARKRWQELRRILDAMEWVSLEACNARGEVLDVVESGIEADDDGPGDDIDTRVVGLTAKIVDLCLAAQDRAVQRTTEHMKELLDASVKVNRAMAEQLTSTMRMYDTKLRLLDELTGGNGDEKELMSEAMLKALAPSLIPHVVEGMKGGSNGTP